MAKTKKEFNKEAMYKKIMPSMFRPGDEALKSDSDENREDDIVNSNLSKIFLEAEKVNSEEILESNTYNNINAVADIIEESQAAEEIKEEYSSDNIDNLDYNLSGSENKYTVNFIEILIKDKLEDVLEKFKCCKCESCLADIVDIALNSFPKYSFEGTKKEIEEAFREFRQSSNVDVVSAIIKAIVLIRKKEKHNKN